MRATKQTSRSVSKKTSSRKKKSSSASSKDLRVQQLLKQVKNLEGELHDVVQKMEYKVHQIERIKDFSAILNSVLDPELVREKALEATCELLDCETASLYLVDHEKQELYWETALGEEGKKLKDSVRLPINDQSFAGYVAQSGESVIVTEVKYAYEPLIFDIYITSTKNLEEKFYLKPRLSSYVEYDGNDCS